MDDKEFIKRSEKLKKEIVINISKKLNVPVFVIDSLAIQKICEDIKKELPTIKKYYSDQELFEEVSNFVSRFTVIRPKDETEAKRRIEEFAESLEKEKKYEAFFILPNVIGLPIGTRIGSLEIVEQKIEDKNFIEFLENQKKNKKIYIDGRTQAKVEFSAYTSVNVRNVLYKILELPLAILSLILDFDIDSRNLIGRIKSKDASTVYYIEPQRECYGFSTYRGKYYDKYLEQLSEISVDNKPTPLHKKILQALQVYGLSRLSQKEEIRFLFLISSFESLLLTKNDRDYLGKKISEKTTFLLEKEYDKRLKLYKQMKNFYNKRSDLIHNGKMQISVSEIYVLENIFQTLVFCLLELSNTYKKMEQRELDNQEEGIEDLVNKFKFS